jgi:hypothetical protein
VRTVETPKNQTPKLLSSSKIYPAVKVDVFRIRMGKLLIGKLILTDLERAFSGRNVFFAESSLLVQMFSVLLDIITNK